MQRCTSGSATTPSASGLGVARQERDCRALAARLGWTVADIYCDNSVSAYSGKDIGERWSEVPLERKRAVISLLAVIRVLPIGKTGRATFDPAGVSVTWQEAPAEPVPESPSE